LLLHVGAMCVQHSHGDIIASNNHVVFKLTQMYYSIHVSAMV